MILIEQNDFHPTLNFLFSAHPLAFLSFHFIIRLSWNFTAILLHVLFLQHILFLFADVNVCSHLCHNSYSSIKFIYSEVQQIKKLFQFLAIPEKTCLPGLFITYFIYSELCFKLVYFYHAEVCTHSNFTKSNYSSSSSLKKVLIQTLHSFERLVFSLQNVSDINAWFSSFCFL